MGKEVGRITEVKGVRVRAELYELFPPYIVDSGRIMVAPRINTYVKTRVGLDEIICHITGEYYDEVHRGQYTGYYLELTVKGYFENGRFIQGLRLLPMVAANIEMLEKDEFKRINENLDEKIFPLGVDLFDSSQNYYLSYNAVIPSHIGIFGNTGSGKSNTLAKLMHEYIEVIKGRNNAQLLVFDVNNEYGESSICSKDNKTIYHLTTRNDNGDKIPINYSKLQEDEWCLLLNATEATQRPVIKTAFSDKRTPDDYARLIGRMISTGQQQLIKSIQYNLAGYVKGIETLKWHAKNQVFYFDKGTGTGIFDSSPEYQQLIDQISVDIPEARIKNFLFRLYFATAIHIGYGTQFEFISPLLRRAEKLFKDFEKVFEDVDEDLFQKKNVIVIQLANVNKDMLELIPAIITNHLFQNQILKKQDDTVKNIINIVIDEAHNLLYEDSTDSKHTKITIDAFERAIKEGRKFGLYLWISSQRPSDISQTIISQMHNYFIHKLVNPLDLSRIRKAVAFLDENALDALTVLGAGECVVSGTGVNMPCFVYVMQLEEKYRPNSENVKLFGENGIFERQHRRVKKKQVL